MSETSKVTQADLAKAEQTLRKKKAENARSRKEEQDRKKIEKLTQEIRALRNESIPRFKAAIKKAEGPQGLEPLIADKVNYINTNKNQPGFPDVPPYSTYLNNLEQAMAPFKSIITQNKVYLAAAEKQISEKTNEIQKLNKGVDNSVKRQTPPKGVKNTTNNTSPKKEKKLKFSKDYKYNAPMIKSAYFGAPSFVDTVQEGNYVDQGSFTDARQSWAGVTGGRGVIQMDKKFLSTFTTSSQSKTPGKIDTQKYGFKFLYNPQTVSMAWGLMTSMDPYYEATQLDKFQVVSSALMQSTVSFELLLNRIHDFSYLNENGLIDSTYAYQTAVVDNRTILTGAKLVNNPYPENISQEDMQEIWKKGTMYDLEYLFKVINGPDATFVSQMSGLKTADRGWMRPTIVELHLGDSMRYRVRISEFSVNHIIFNSRMVPMLSSVKLTVNRFPDGPNVEDITKTSSSSSGSSSSSSSTNWTSAPGPSELRAAGR